LIGCSHLATATIAAFGKHTVYIKMERQSPSAPKMFTGKQARKDQARGEAENNEKNAENLLCSSLS
jgi:hypothetical protein